MSGYGWQQQGWQHSGCDYGCSPGYGGNNSMTFVLIVLLPVGLEGKVLIQRCQRSD